LYDRGRMVVRKLAARVIAPVAIAAPIFGGYLIVHHYVQNHDSHPSHAQVTKPRPKPKGKFKRARFYTVRVGDTLTRIASRTGLTIERLQALNPRINPNALQTGQRLRLRR
jgi:LysM repeat protein